MWTPDVCETLMESGAEILVFINGSPYERDKVDVRMNHAVARVTENELPLIYVNQVGGQDELVFDGGSFVLNPGGALAVKDGDAVVAFWYWSCMYTIVRRVESAIAPLRARGRTDRRALVVGRSEQVQSFIGNLRVEAIVGVGLLAR